MPARDYNWGGFTPWAHQEASFYRARDRLVWAHFWEMRTGKTPTVIHEAAYLKSRGKIDGMLVTSPNYLKDVWAEQFEEHAPDWLDTNIVVWEPKEKVQREVVAMRPDGPLNVLLMNEEAFSTSRGVAVATAFLKAHQALWVVDESTSIANHKAQRTKNILKMRTLAPYRRILTGTPSTKSPLDLWAQMYFLDPGILGFSNFYGFRNRYATLGGFKGKEVVGYIDIDLIQSKLSRHSDRVLRSDIRDMPPKLYQKATVPLTPQQEKIYAEFKAEMLAEWENTDREHRRLEVRSILAQMLRLQQVVGGFVPSEDEDGDVPYRAPEPIPGGNPRLDALVGYAQASDDGTKIVIFARFRAEIQAIVERLRGTFGEQSVVEFHGGVKPAEKDAAKRAFKDPDSPVRFFVANQRSARMGLDLSVAKLVLWYSNSFDFLDRIQGEDRTETVKSESESTMHVDIISSAPIDRTVLQSLRDKKKISDLVTGDEPLSNWI